MPSSKPLTERARQVAEAFDLTPANLAALLCLASLACAGLVALWWVARPTPIGADGPTAVELLTADVAPTVASGTVPDGPPERPAVAPTSGPGAGGATTVVVHVSGAVAAAGVVELGAGARVVDAIEAAGGQARGARTDRLNLARVVGDGEQIHVPSAKEVRDGAVVGTSGGAAGTSGAGSAAAASTPGGTGGAGATGADAATVNLNAADAAALETLPGVGPVLAQRIIDHREAAGGFTSVDELLEVDGIGAATLAELRDHVAP